MIFCLALASLTLLSPKALDSATTAGQSMAQVISLPVAPAQESNTVYSLCLGWDAAADVTVTGYRVYYGVAPRTYTNTLDAGGALSITVNNLLDGPRYFYAATAYNVLGMESQFSKELAWPPYPSDRMTISWTNRAATVTILTATNKSPLARWNTAATVTGTNAWTALLKPGMNLFVTTIQGTNLPALGSNHIVGWNPLNL
jgi:hypothetical protein